MFTNLIVKQWEEWMTECVLLAESGLTVAELRRRFQKPDNLISNVLSTTQAEDIRLHLRHKNLTSAKASDVEKMAAIRSKALSHTVRFLDNEELAIESPMAFQDQTRKILDSISRMQATPATTTNNINILNVQPEMLEHMRNASSLKRVEIPANVEYLGKPPQGVHGSGIPTLAGEGKDRLNVLGAGSAHATQQERLPSVPTPVQLVETARK